MLLGPKVPLDVAPAGPHVRIDDRVLDGSRRAPHLVDRASHRPGGLAVAPCADLTIHSVARRKGRSCAVGSRCQSAVTSRVAQPLERAVDRGGEFAQASVASSSSADACATCSFSFSPRPFSLLPLTLFSCALVSDAGVGSPIVSVWLSAPALRGLGGCCPRHCWARRFAHGDMRSIARS